MKPLSILALVMLAGCVPSPEPTIAMQKAPPEAPVFTNDPRFTVVRVAVFEDEIAYGDRRGIYIITDTQTGREFVGVSGVGISETGSHNCGKGCTAQDER
jgi:hypothetical protein